MPCLNSSYQSPFYFRNGHIQSVLPTIFRQVEGVNYRRERITTADGDFLDLDWSGNDTDRLMIISHGLEGHSQRKYVKGMVSLANRSGWDACAWNFRGCSEEPNRKPYLYHSGATYDLDSVIQHVLENYAYREIVLVGFSLGGNITIKYFGEQGDRLADEISCGVTFSVPVDLYSSSIHLSQPANRIYMKRFLHLLHEKIQAKQQMYPDLISDAGFEQIKDFKAFDDRYTAPLHGFKNAEDYWLKASSKPWIPEIKRPLLLVNAMDDPFLPPECFPYEEANTSPYLYLETPRHGGHTGFIANGLNGVYWSEKRVISFHRSLTQHTVSA